MLPAAVKAWLSASPGRAVGSDRFGGIVLTEQRRFARRQAFFASLVEAAVAIDRNAISWEPAELRLGAGHR